VLESGSVGSARFGFLDPDSRVKISTKNCKKKFNFQLKSKLLKKDRFDKFNSENVFNSRNASRHFCTEKKKTIQNN